MKKLLVLILMIALFIPEAKSQLDEAIVYGGIAFGAGVGLVLKKSKEKRSRQIKSGDCPSIRHEATRLACQERLDEIRKDSMALVKAERDRELEELRLEKLEANRIAREDSIATVRESERIANEIAREERNKERERLEEIATKKREKEILKKYGKEDGNLILDQRVRVGFTMEMCREALGEPSATLLSASEYGEAKSWTYHNYSYSYILTLLFVDDKLANFSEIKK